MQMNFHNFVRTITLTLSSQMETEGLIRGLAFLSEHNVSITSFTTDCYPGTKKYEVAPTRHPTLL